MPERWCLVLIPAEHGGNCDYDVQAESSMEAARMGLQRHRQVVPDDAVITVIIEGHGLSTHDCTEHNAKQPTYRHLAGAVRATSRG